MQDRPYQLAALAAIQDGYAQGVTRQLLHMATGTGKTVVFSQLPEAVPALPGQMITLAHREELIDQNIDKMRTINPSLTVDKEMAAHHADPSTADCIVASVASLKNRLGKYNWERFDKMVVDEAHHSPAITYMNIFDQSGFLRRTDSLLLGATATPQRGDGQALAKIYQKVIYSYGIRKAVADGWLVEPCGNSVKTNTSLDDVKISAGDYNIGSLSETVDTPERNQEIVAAWLKYGEGRQTVAFTVNILHAQHLAEMFRHYGVAAEAIWSNDSERVDKLTRHRSRQTTVLCNCGILTEGYDDWQIGCIVLARPTRSGVLFAQMVGRGTRLEDGTGNLHEARKHAEANGFPLKVDCIVIDVVDLSSRHSLVTLPTLMGLPATLDLQGEGVYRAVCKIEDAQKEYPHIDFSKLTDISTLSSYIQRVDLFNVAFAPEVEASSELSWHPAATGGYVLWLPDKESVRISQNLLDKWEIKGIIKGQRYKGERDSVEDAFSAADTIIQNNCHEVLNLVRRESFWHSDPPTQPQLNLLKKLFRGKPLPPNLDKGQASKLIARSLAAKA